jgi:hypothetical protein
MSWGLSAEEGRDGPVAPYAPGFSQLPIQQDLMLLDLEADVLNYCLGWMAAEAITFSIPLYFLFR